MSDPYEPVTRSGKQALELGLTSPTLLERIEREAAAAERERLMAEVRESGRVGVSIQGHVTPARTMAYSEGFHHGIREALDAMAAATPEDER